jgi:hypothetical protein
LDWVVVGLRIAGAAYDPDVVAWISKDLCITGFHLTLGKIGCGLSVLVASGPEA